MYCKIINEEPVNLPRQLLENNTENNSMECTLRLDDLIPYFNSQKSSLGIRYDKRKYVNIGHEIEINNLRTSKVAYLRKPIILEFEMSPLLIQNPVRLR